MILLLRQMLQKDAVFRLLHVIIALIEVFRFDHSLHCRISYVGGLGRSPCIMGLTTQDPYSGAPAARRAAKRSPIVITGKKRKPMKDFLMIFRLDRGLMSASLVENRARLF